MIINISNFTKNRDFGGRKKMENFRKMDYFTTLI